MESGEKDTNTTVDHKRRRLTKAAAASPIVASLISRPVWGTTCSLSGLQSGNLSGTAKTGCEGSGCTPGFWKNSPASWVINTIYSPGNCKTFNSKNGKCAEWDAGSGTTFVGAFGVSPGGAYADSTMMEILLRAAGKNGNDDYTQWNDETVLSHCIAALLNANAAPNTYGANTQQVIDAVAKALTGTLTDNLGNSIPLKSATDDKDLFSVLVRMNEAGGGAHCTFNNHGFCGEHEVSNGTECIPACSGNETYDMCTRQCVENKTMDSDKVVTVEQVLQGTKTLCNCPDGTIGKPPATDCP